jgi:hypothetical protein
MWNFSICLAGAVAAVMAATQARAQDHPTWPPTRDVTVTYAVSSAQSRPGQPTQVNIAFSATLQKMRVDIGPQGYMIVDVRSHASQMVMPQQRMVMTLPQNAATPARAFDYANAANMTRLGTETIAGYKCTVWRMTRAGAQAPSEACFTDDGTLLRSRGGGPAAQDTGVEAQSVSYNAVPASSFEPPAGFTVMTAPSGMPMQGMSAPQHR